MTFATLFAVVAGLALLNSGCTSSPAAPAQVGVMPVSGRFIISEPEGVPALVYATVAERLEARGLVQESEADYLVQLAVTRHAPNLQVATAEDNAPGTGKPRNVSGRAKGRPLVELAITVSDIKTGAELYRAAAAASANRAPLAMNVAQLVAAVMPGSPQAP